MEYCQDPGEVPESICQAEDPAKRATSDCMASRNLIKSKETIWKKLYFVDKVRIGNLYYYFDKANQKALKVI